MKIDIKGIKLKVSLPEHVPLVFRIFLPLLFFRRVLIELRTPNSIKSLGVLLTAQLLSDGCETARKFRRAEVVPLLVGSPSFLGITPAILCLLSNCCQRTPQCRNIPGPYTQDLSGS